FPGNVKAADAYRSRFSNRVSHLRIFVSAPIVSGTVSAVTEIKSAVRKLPSRKKVQLARWLKAQIDDRLEDGALMAVAAEGARALDRREAAYAKRKVR